MLRIDNGAITIIPVLHAKAAFAKEVRRQCLATTFDSIAIDVPEIFEPYLAEAIEALPIIQAIVARETDGPLYYLPIDPCDAAIEAVRQSFQHHVPFYCIGAPTCARGEPLPELPDEHSIAAIGIDAFNTLCLGTLAGLPSDPVDRLHGRYMAMRLRQLRQTHRSVIAIVHIRHIVEMIREFQSPNETAEPLPPSPYTMLAQVINPDHLYFALGELPFITGKYERERYDALAPPFDPVTSIKELFRETRDEFSDRNIDAAPLSPVRIQSALTFLRNLTVLSGRLLPALSDIIEAAKGVGGNSYGLSILKAAKYYPWLPMENRADMLAIGTERMRVPAWETTDTAVNLFRDHRLVWQTVSLRPDPSELRKKKYRYQWNPFGMCSHVPEDTAIERFNGAIRQKALKTLVEDHARTEKFSSSVKDGIDIRDTLRFWHTGDIYVRELPPARGKIDTVIIIFDENNDGRYPHRATWYAEHPDESTLTFYATDPFEKLIGPGIARSYYGGLSLLFPPRPVPDIFRLKTGVNLPNNTASLTLGGLLFSREKVIAYVAPRKPGAFLTNLARNYRKRLLWIPLSTFSQETVQRLRQFHILNGKDVRSWATRFIGD